MEAFYKFKTFLQSGKNRELPVEGASTEEEIKHRVVVNFAGLPVGVGHRNLIEI